MEADFGGYATKANLKCTDGKTITPAAFQHMDKMQVPLVWNHKHSDNKNVLGHAILEARPDGIWAHGYFNETEGGKNGKIQVQHGDIKAMSIYANNVAMQGKSVVHGNIREVSLVLAGANPGATIENVQVRHGADEDDIETISDEIVIHLGFNIEEESFAHATKPAAKAVPPVATKTETSTAKKPVPSASSDSSGDGDGADAEDSADTADDASAQAVYDTFTPKQKKLVDVMVGLAAQGSGDDTQHADGDDKDDENTTEGDLAHQEGTGPVTNVFEQANKNKTTDGGVIRHNIDEDGLKAIFKDAKKSGSLMDTLADYVVEHGIESVDALFPNPQLLNSTPDFNSRNMAWVQNVLDSTRKSPFSRIKTIVADITLDEARAKGYVKGNFKKEEWIQLTSRTTTPTTVYKKQKLDRDDVLDIVDFDVVVWLKGEMRIMLSEEVAVAILLGDGRDPEDEDHVLDPSGANSGPGVRSILNDDELYVTRVNVNVSDTGSNWDEVADQVLDASQYYKGTGNPVFYATQRTINKLLLSKDANLHRNYDNKQALAAAMGVSDVVAVEPMLRFPNLLGIVVNLTDYNIGTDRGGEVNLFDFFDIDYNQLKYLMETRMSGALVKVKSAMVLSSVTGTVLVPTPATFVPATGVITIPTQAGVVYKNGDGTTLTAGAQTALAAGTSELVRAVASAGYFFSVTGTAGQDEWTFQRPAAS